jgi:23S rRNA (cytosine1962-C5)-methyltransferase
MSKLPAIVLKAKKAQPFYCQHPWLFSGAIESAPADLAVGQQVRVLNFDKKFVAYGLANPDSNLRVRLYAWDEDRPLDEAMVAARIENAVRMRHVDLGLDDPAGACRLVYSESDRLSGLVVDRYADMLCVQFNSKALATYEPVVVATLDRLLKPRGIYRRVDRAAAELEGMDATEGVLAGVEPGDLTIAEHGLRWHAELVGGQKTGLFLDQRDNRAAFARYVKGRKVLDVCCYGGGFSLAALKLGAAASATGIDSSGPAIKLAQRNAELNGLKAEFLHGPALDVLAQLRREGRKFGAIVTDPPKFAKKAADLEAASRGYEHLNRAALEILEPGGILCACSCSGNVTNSAFLHILQAAGQKSGRHLQILEHRGQAPDHPIALSCFETSYLKCVIARAE